MLLSVLAAFMNSSAFAQLVEEDTKKDDTEEKKDEVKNIDMGAYMGYMNSYLFITLIIYILVDILSIIFSNKLHFNIVKNLLKGSFPKFYNLILTGKLLNRLSNDI